MLCAATIIFATRTENDVIGSDDEISGTPDCPKKVCNKFWKQKDRVIGMPSRRAKSQPAGTRQPEAVPQGSAKGSEPSNSGCAVSVVEKAQTSMYFSLVPRVLLPDPREVLVRFTHRCRVSWEVRHIQFSGSFLHTSLLSPSSDQA